MDGKRVKVGPLVSMARKLTLSGLVFGALAAGPAVLRVPPGRAQAAAPVTITLMLAQDATETLTWAKAASQEFEKANPGIHVSIIAALSGNFADKLAVLRATGNTPDVWQGGNRTDVRNGWLLDLTRYIERDKEELRPQEFMSSAWKAYAWGGKIWGVPFVSSGSFVYYNPDLFDLAGLKQPPVEWEKTGWTWDDMLASAKKLSILDEKGGLKQAGIGIEPSFYPSEVYSYLWGGDWFDEETYRTGIVHQSTFFTQANLDAYQAVVDLMWKHHFAPKTGEAWTWDWFQKGKVAMYMGNGPWTVMGKNKVLKIRWGLAPLPLVKDRASIVFTDGLVIGSETKHPEEAWKLVKWLLSQQELLQYSSHSDLPPARSTALVPYITQLAAHSRYHTPSQIMQALMGAQEYGHDQLAHVIIGYGDISSRLSPIWAQMWANQISVSSAMQQADAAIRAYMLTKASGSGTASGK
ncbi:MAG: sugar ABC transporter substrate-binding protein [Limnochordaceae bacterium]|nr:sugar ABC transporter substrate-binding protein [Limnochordaceae bacterium]